MLGELINRPSVAKELRQGSMLLISGRNRWRNHSRAGQGSSAIMPTLKQVRKRISNLYCGNPVVYHHLPKCGGTSVVHALRMRCLPSYALFPTDCLYRAIEALHPGCDEEKILEQVIEFREKQLLALMFEEVKCIAGHVRVCQVACDIFINKYAFITTLRDPVSLMISLYFYDKNHPLARWRTDKDIEAYLETPRARQFGAVYSDFYCGLPPDSDMHSRDAIDRAKRNLQGFSVIGTVDNMAAFQRRLRQVLNVGLRIGHLNKANVSGQDLQGTVTADVRRKIEKMSVVNQEIYDYVRDNLAA